MNVRNLLSRWSVIAIVCAATSGAAVTPALVATAASSGPPNFGSNVHVFSPAMAQSQVQASLDAVSGVQVNSQFGTQRAALLFEPGTYGSASNPLVFERSLSTGATGKMVAVLKRGGAGGFRTIRYPTSRPPES